jgi:hypothetical protein
MSTWMIDVQIAHTVFALNIKRIHVELNSTIGADQTIAPMIGRFETLRGELRGFRRLFYCHGLQATLEQVEKNRRFQSFLARHQPAKALTESQLFFYHKFVAVYALTAVRFYQLKTFFRGQQKFTTYNKIKKNFFTHAHALVMDWILHEIDAFNEAGCDLFRIRLRFHHLQVPKLIFNYQQPTETLVERFTVLALIELGDERIQFNRFDREKALEGKESRSYVAQMRHRGQEQFLLSDF